MRFRIVALLLAVVAGTTVVSSAGAAAAASSGTCGGQPILVTSSCVDPRFNDAYAFVDVDVMRQSPIPHRFVRGGFRGTDATFAFYFPAAINYEGRFFQGPIHQLRFTSEVASPDELRFAFDSGAYLIETNNGGSESCLTARDCLSGRYDATVRGYRVNAAAAKFSRVMAQQIYGRSHRPYGYLYGGSGGAYMTVSAAEHTTGVWDGYVPFVFGHPRAIPDHFTIRINALRVLRERNKLPCIMDAVDAGGSGDPFGSCRLNDIESQAFREATRLGFPPRGWFNHSTMTGGALSLVANYVPLLDPSYAEDFWTKPGYLGTEQSAAGIDVRSARLRHRTTVVAAAPQVPAPFAGVPTVPYDAMGPAYNYYVVGQYAVGLPPKAFQLESMPAASRNLEGADLVVESGSSTGRSCPLMVLAASLVTCGGNSDPAVINGIGRGDKVRIDNSLYLALQTHHRHQVPDDRDYYGWDQFRGAHYPQRSQLIGPAGAFHAGGSVSTGRFHGKMIMVENLLDQDALAWSADWYRRKVASDVGEGNVDKRFRVWFNDNAIHTGSPDPNYAIDYIGILQQALRDVAAWAERGKAPPASTRYDIGGRWDTDEAQVRVPALAAERRGVQPTIDLQVVGGKRTDRADVEAGQSVKLRATITAPPGAGRVTCAEWTFEAPNTFTPSPVPGVPGADFVDPGGQVAHPALLIAPKGCDYQARTVTINATHTYKKPGAYYVVLQAVSQRQGNPKAQFGLVRNLARVRVVVK